MDIIMMMMMISPSSRRWIPIGMYSIILVSGLYLLLTDSTSSISEV